MTTQTIDKTLRLHFRFSGRKPSLAVQRRVRGVRSHSDLFGVRVSRISAVFLAKHEQGELGQRLSWDLYVLVPSMNLELQEQLSNSVIAELETIGFELLGDDVVDDAVNSRIHRMPVSVGA